MINIRLPKRVTIGTLRTQVLYLNGWLCTVNAHSELRYSGGFYSLIVTYQNSPDDITYHSMTGRECWFTIKALLNHTILTSGENNK